MRLQSDGRWGRSHLESSLTHKSGRGLKRLRTGMAGTSEASLSPAVWSPRHNSVKIATLLNMVAQGSRDRCRERESQSQAIQSVTNIKP